MMLHVFHPALVVFVSEPEAKEENFNPVAAAIKRSNAKLVLEDSSDNDEGLEEPTSKSNPSDSRNASSSKGTYKI